VVTKFDVQRREVCSADRTDEWREDVLHERVDDVFERGTDDDADGQVDDVAAQDERLEFLQHRTSLINVANASVNDRDSTPGSRSTAASESRRSPTPRRPFSRQ